MAGIVGVVAPISAAQLISPRAGPALEVLLKDPSLPQAVLCYLEATNLRQAEHGLILEVPSQFHFNALKKYEQKFCEILRVSELIFEVKKQEARSGLPLPTAPAPTPFRPRAVEMPAAVAIAPAPRMSEQSNLDLEKSRRLPVPSMTLSPNFQMPFEITKRWADAVNRNGNQVLWVSGKSGSGKTHLLRQLHEWVSLKKRVVHVDAMNFFHEWRRALESKDMGFARKYRRETDLLVLENIDFLENKHKTQEEVLITVNSLLDRGASIAVSSSRSPASLREVLDPSLFSRLFGGMIVEMPTPDRPFKDAMFRQLLDQHGLRDWPVDAVVMERIYNIPLDSARSVHTLMVNALANLSLKGALSLKEVSDLEARFAPQEGPKIGNQSSPAEFVDKISRLCGVGMSAIQGNGRRSEISLARKFVCLALCRFLGMTNSSIAVYVNKDASTVSKALQAIEDEICTDRHIGGQWGYICQQLGVSPSFERNFD